MTTLVMARDRFLSALPYNPCFSRTTPLNQCLNVTEFHVSFTIAHTHSFLIPILHS